MQVTLAASVRCWSVVVWLFGLASVTSQTVHVFIHCRRCCDQPRHRLGRSFASPKHGAVDQVRFRRDSVRSRCGQICETVSSGRHISYCAAAHSTSIPGIRQITITTTVPSGLRAQQCSRFVTPTMPRGCASCGRPDRYGPARPLAHSARNVSDPTVATFCGAAINRPRYHRLIAAAPLSVDVSGCTSVQCARPTPADIATLEADDHLAQRYVPQKKRWDWIWSGPLCRRCACFFALCIVSSMQSHECDRAARSS